VNFHLGLSIVVLAYFGIKIISNARDYARDILRIIGSL